MDAALLWYLAAAALVFVGLAGVVLPALPGVPLVFAGMWIAAWAADYTRIGANGALETRKQVLAGFRASESGGSMEPTELDVDVYGDTAILTGKLTIASATGSRQSRFRKIFVRRDGRWYMVSLQGTPLQGR